MKLLNEEYKDRTEQRNRFRLLLVSAVLLLVVLLVGPKAFGNEKVIRQIASIEAIENGLDPNLVLAVIQVESSFNPNAVGGSHGEVGLMQLHPRFFPNASFDIEQNIKTGVQELARLKKLKLKYAGCAWFVHYNIGANRIPRAYQEHPYFKKVTRVYPEYCDRLQNITVAGAN